MDVVKVTDFAASSSFGKLLKYRKTISMKCFKYFEAWPILNFVFDAIMFFWKIS